MVIDSGLEILTQHIKPRISNSRTTIILLLLLNYLGFCVFHSALGDIKSSPYIEVDLISHILSLKQNNQLIKSYPIGVSKSKQFLTPPGHYKIEVKDKNPGWINPFNPRISIPPGKNNPLGTLWIGFHDNKGGEYGIHGTNQPNSVGKSVSHGCVRMLIPDIEDLFERVEIGTNVEVLYQRFKVVDIEGDLALTIKSDPYQIEPLEVNNIEKFILSKYPKAKINRQAIQKLLEEKNPLNQTRLVGNLEPKSM
jgi:hypothetical protein